MKTILLISILLVSLLSKSQDSFKSALIAGETIEFTSNLDVNQGFQSVSNEDFRLTWMFIKRNPSILGWTIHQENNEIILTTNIPLEELGKTGLTNSQKKMNVTSIQKVQFNLLGTNIEGHILVNEQKKKTIYIFIIAGVINDREVLFQSQVYKNPINNDAIPNELKKVIRFM